jgi:pimeloyl-ACP methyl ester carboxylesterase
MQKSHAGITNFIAIAIAIAALLPSGASAGEFTSSRVTITTEGSGKDVILIPGHSSSPRVWTEMIAAVPGYRYHLVQVKGFAGAPRDGNGEGDVVAPVADEISRYVEETKLGSVIVVGHSMGGTIGMMLAARRPQQVSKLMVVDMVPFLGLVFGGPDATPASVKPLAGQIRAAIAGTPADVGEKRLRATIAGMIRTESMRPLALEDAVTTDPDVAGRAYEELIMTDLRPELANIEAKSLILYAITGVQSSDLQIESNFSSSYAALKGVSFKVAPKSAHFIMWDNPQWFQAEVRSFLAD